MLLGAIAMPILTTSCTSTAFKPVPHQPGTMLCPALVHYSDSDQDAIARELAAVPGGAAKTARALKDYHDLRIIISAECK